MKESHLYERNEDISTKKSTQLSQRNGPNSVLKSELMEGVFKLMQFLVHAEQRIQIFKQMLTQRNDFSPQPLYYYVSRDQRQIDKKHLMLLFQENQLSLQQEYIKLYLNSYGFKERIDYSAFINLIFPENTDLIKYISVTGIKKYSNQSSLSQDVLCIFLMLVQEQIRLLEGLDALKNQLIPKITRKEIKNLMRIIKRNGECNSLMQIESQPFVRYEQLKTLFKNYVSKTSKSSNLTKKMPKKSVQFGQNNQTSEIYSFLQGNSLNVFRKLSMGKTNFINLEDFEFWLKPWNKQRATTNNGQESGPCSSNIFALSGINEIDNQSKISLGQNLSIPLSHVC